MSERALAEDGAIGPQYQLTETDTPDYASRTERNVLDCDATLILCRGQPTGGTELTWRLAQRHGKPHLVVDLLKPIGWPAVRRWLAAHGAGTLNVAGPRKAKAPALAFRPPSFSAACSRSREAAMARPD